MLDFMLFLSGYVDSQIIKHFDMLDFMLGLAIFGLQLSSV
jgi:hypothetical protein